tara:strand:+ start:580 stop:2451 length:1872 start_codon:yes stop_codon:yes gene_type:complete
MENKKENKENLEFQAEVSKLLDLVANSLYSEREIFLRELISNSADACEKLRYEAVSKKDILGDDKDFKISVRFSKKNKTIQVEDNGLGMTKQELIDNLGTIARSGTNRFIQAMKSKNDNDISAIGQFGVGFYSSYMVAESVDVISKNPETNESYLWSSKGKNSYTIESASKKDRGTLITLKIKKDSEEFLDDLRLRSIITKYSNYVNFPIFLKNLDEKEKEDKVNEGNPLWLKDKKIIKKEDYKQFYNNISFNFDEPVKTIHYSAEGVINYKALLYIPTNQPLDLFQQDRKNKIKLYVQKIFITDECEEIIPNWLRFIPGIIDSQDISLNISREMLQNNPVINKIKKAITSKVLSELISFSNKEKESYLNFWKNFGAVIKEGLYEMNDFHDKILPLLRFQTSESSDELISLDYYLDNIKDSQKEIYYFANTDKDHIKNSPQLETFIENKIPVLFMTDAVDEFWLQNIQKYKDKNFKSITKGKVEIPNKKNKVKDKDKTKLNKDNKINDLINVLKKELEDKISDVIISERLTKSPILLVADESSLDINMEKLMKIHNKQTPDSKKILELNSNHPMIIKLSESLNKYDHKKLSNLLLDQANILDGNVLSNPSGYIDAITDFFIKN